MLTFRDVTYATVPTNPQYTLDQSFGRDVFFSFSYGNSGYQLGCTIAAVSDQQAVQKCVTKHHEYVNMIAIDIQGDSSALRPGLG